MRTIDGGRVTVLGNPRLLSLKLLASRLVGVWLHTALHGKQADPTA